jgi:hypothetical protein
MPKDIAMMKFSPISPLKKPHTLLPIALSFVEGCTQSPHKDWSAGVLEWWSDGFETQYSNTPLLQHPASFVRLASESFLRGLKMKILAAC